MIYIYIHISYIFIYIYIHTHICHMLETNKTLEMNYASIKKNKIKILYYFTSFLLEGK